MSQRTRNYRIFFAAFAFAVVVAILTTGYTVLQLDLIHFPLGILPVASIGAASMAAQAVVGWVATTSPVGLPLTLTIVVGVLALAAAVVYHYVGLPWRAAAPDVASVEEDVLGEDYDDFEEL